MLKWLFLLMVAWLATRFVLQLFWPGTTETRALFQALEPYWPWMDGLTTALTLPLWMLWWSVQGALPPQVTAFFPKIPVAALAQWAGQLAPTLASPAVVKSLAEQYPGEVEWLTLAAIPMWLTVQSALDSLWDALRRGVTAWTQMAEAEQQRVLVARPRATSSAPVDDPAYLAQSNTHGDYRVRQMLSSLKAENRRLQQSANALKETFGQYVSPRVLSYLEAHPECMSLSAENQTLTTVLFVDLRGFTAYSQQHAPSEINAYLRNFFEITHQVILHEHHGTLNKLIGDAVMAYWNFPMPDPAHAYHATMAALTIQDRLNRYNQQPGVEPIGVTMGISTGLVSIGNVGSRDFKDFTVIGPPVNLASRLQAANRELNTEILIDEATHALLNRQILCRSHGAIPIKGLPAPQAVFVPVRPA